MFKKTFTFVEHSKGEYEGVQYDNVLLSDGITTGKFRNETGQHKLDFQRGDEVECEFDISFEKNNRVGLHLRTIV